MQIKKGEDWNGKLIERSCLLGQWISEIFGVCNGNVVKNKREEQWGKAYTIRPKKREDAMKMKRKNEVGSLHPTHLYGLF